MLRNAGCWPEMYGGRAWQPLKGGLYPRAEMLAVCCWLTAHNNHSWSVSQPERRVQNAVHQRCRGCVTRKRHCMAQSSVL